ncbi:MAG TPA: hypothetical protein VMP13_03820 [Acidimicrobiia bacterium]|nr:hypothetical protein [Acidimicrobiia bacterium]
MGAAYGLLILSFKEGAGPELFKRIAGEAIEAFLPLFLFTIVFGLSMDYHVFLLAGS